MSDQNLITKPGLLNVVATSESNCDESEDVVITNRGGIVENRHRIHGAVVDSEGKL
jgi:hypothetical protein